MINIHLKNDLFDEVYELIQTSPNLHKKFEVHECECTGDCEAEFTIHCYECEDDLMEIDNTYHLDLDELRTDPREAVFLLLSAFPTF